MYGGVNVKCLHSHIFFKTQWVVFPPIVTEDQNHSLTLHICTATSEASFFYNFDSCYEESLWKLV